MILWSVFPNPVTIIDMILILTKQRDLIKSSILPIIPVSYTIHMYIYNDVATTAVNVVGCAMLQLTCNFTLSCE